MKHAHMAVFKGSKESGATQIGMPQSPLQAPSSPHWVGNAPVGVGWDLGA